MGIVFSIFALLFLFVILGGTFLLQIVLSKTESKWPGLILPFVSLGVSLLAVIGALSFYGYSETGPTIVTTMDETGQIIEVEEVYEDLEEVTIFESEGGGERPSFVRGILTTVFIFIVANIPTGVLILIYSDTRKRLNRNRKIDHTRILDL